MENGVVIPQEELLQLLYIRLKDPTTFACINTILTILNIDGIELRSNRFAQFYGNLATMHYIPFFRELLVNLIAWGFCPYIDSNIEVNTTHDKEYMDTHNRATTTVRVPTIPMFGTYITRIVQDKKTYQGMLECQFKEDLMNSKKKFPPIKIITSRMFGIPMIYNGVILFKTPIAAIQNSYFNLAQLNAFAVQAYYSLANPTILLQVQKLTPEEEERSIHLQSYGISDLTNAPGSTQQIMHYKQPIEIETRHNERIMNYKKKCAQDANDLVSYYRDTTRVVTNNIQLERSFLNGQFVIEDGFEVAPHQAPLAKAPDNMDEFSMRHAQVACNVFGLPYSLLDKAGITKTNGSNDLQKVTKVINSYVCEMNCVFDDIMRDMELDHDLMEFIIHPQTFVPDIDSLIKLHESETYPNKKLVQREIENSFSVTQTGKRLKHGL